MTSKRFFAHQRSKTIVYVEIQRRRQLIIINENANADHSFVDSIISNSLLSFVRTMFISFSSRIAFVDDKIFTIVRKSTEKKYAKKMSRVKKRKIIHKANAYFYNNFYDKLFIIC